MQQDGSSKKLLIIDGYGFIFRAYHVQPPLISPKGQAVGAIYGFTSMLLKLINDFKPEYAIIVLDNGENNFRHELYSDYKSHRPPAPEDLVSQLKLIKNTASALNFHYISKIGYEADDIIATLARKATQEQKEAVIISSDKDLMQLLNSHVRLYDPVKAKYISEDDILAKFGVPASQVREVQALIGDASDNIPGVRGVGPKTASSLIAKYGTVENIYNSLDQLTARQKQLLENNRDNAFLSWKLVGLDDQVEIDHELQDFTWTPPRAEIVSAFVHEYGFKSLHKRIENIFNTNITAKPGEADYTGSSENISLPQIVLSKENAEGNKIELENFLINIKATGIVGIYAHQVSSGMLALQLCDGKKIYIIENYDVVKAASLNRGDIEADQESDFLALKMVKEIISDYGIKKITYNLKNFASLLWLSQTDIEAFEDIMLMHYVLNCGNKLDLWQEIQDAAEMAKTEPIALFLDYYNALLQQILSSKILHLYSSEELPLSKILLQMERLGVLVNRDYLNGLSAEFGSRISKIEERIFHIAGKEFNIASPKQLGEILFIHMNLPYGKKLSVKSTPSTNSEILEVLSAQGFEIADLILEYRHLSKLKNTYTDSLPDQINADTGRVHTSFMQCATSTGRLSSNSPNLQNIPVRSEEGSSIRRAFIAKDGCCLISADYSQIELRILSSVAEVLTLKNALAHSIDVHAYTASEVFSMPLDQVTSDLRRKAKAINFGIIYGISAFGLAKQLGIEKKEAASYMEKYFLHYPGIKSYMQQTIEQAREDGFVTNLLGRKIFLPGINSKEHILRSFSERAAINAPMQSLASEIIKIAMINVDKALKENNMQTKMLLQIHDELLFEAPQQELEYVVPMIKNAMEQIHIADINLVSQVKIGPNWQQMESK